MKKLIIWLTIASLLFSLTFLPAAATGAGSVVYQNTQAVADNLSLTNTISWDGSVGRQESFALSLTGSGDAYPIVMACDTIYGSLSVSKMISYAESLGYNVLAAVNTDFYSTMTGVPLGIVIEDGTYKSSPEGHSSVVVGSDGKFTFSDGSEVTITLQNAGSASNMTNSGKTVTLTHFNKYRTDPGGLYLFSSAFSTVSTRTSSDGWFVRFKILEGTPSVSGTMTLEVVETLESPDAQTIGDGYLVLSAGTAANLGDEYAKFSVGDQVTLTTTCSDPSLINAEWATGGGDILIKSGAITDSSTWDKAITAKNPRTAIGVKADGTIVTYVIDGRESDNSSGLTLKALAEELLALGCVDAINLDGGGSSVMSVQMPGTSSCAIINTPSDGSSRRVAAYLLFVTDASSDGKAHNLGISNDGFEVLAGSSIDLSYYATDSGYMPVAVPGDIVVASGGLGTVSGATYTAGETHGVDTLTLTSRSTGASGTATTHIIYDPTAVTVTEQGSSKSISALNLDVGQTVQLAVSASYYNLPVYFDSDAVVYTLDGDIGEISETGLFTAGTGGGATGTLTVSVGGCSKEIPVKVSGFADTVGHWASAYIKNLFNKGIVTGVTDTTFAPESSIKRGDFVLMLYRAAGEPETQAITTFTDVTESDYYATAIAWAEECGIAQGSGDELFNPQSVLTREQAFTLVYRALSSLNITYTDWTADSLNKFSDAGSLSEYAVTPTATLVGMGIVSGSDGLLTPKAEITRAQMAKILNVVLNLV